jgi:TolA-binding protein
MKPYFYGCLLLLALVVGACTDRSPRDLLETARLEEKQLNPEHAAALYREIISRFPDSDAAKTAAVRLEAMDPKP